jgi:hypothetical protein
MLSDHDIRERLLEEPAGAVAERQEEPPPRKRPPWFLGILAMLAVALWGGGIALFLHMERTSPHVPDPQNGHIYRFGNRRNVVYLTATQHWVANGSLLVLPVITVGLGLAARRRKPGSRKPTLW